MSASATQGSHNNEKDAGVKRQKNVDTPNRLY